MKLNAKQMAELLHINKETLRLYRSVGLINPTQNQQNQYYEFDENDYYTLLFIRRLRGHDVSLKNIHHLLHDDQEGIDDTFFDDEIKKNLEMQKELAKQLNGLIACKQHFESCKENVGRVSEMIFNDDKYDIRLISDDKKVSSLTASWVASVELMTLSLSITKEDLVSNPKTYPFHFCLSLYEQQRKEFGLEKIKSAAVFKHGLYLTSIVKVKMSSSIPSSVIQPMIDYAETNNFEFESGTTGFLIKIDQSKECPEYYFRIRAKVKKKS